MPYHLPKPLQFLLRRSKNTSIRAVDISGDDEHKYLDTIPENPSVDQQSHTTYRSLLNPPIRESLPSPLNFDVASISNDSVQTTASYRESVSTNFDDFMGPERGGNPWRILDPMTMPPPRYPERVSPVNRREDPVSTTPRHNGLLRQSRSPSPGLSYMSDPNNDTANTIRQATEQPAAPSPQPLLAPPIHHPVTETEITSSSQRSTPPPTRPLVLPPTRRSPGSELSSQTDSSPCSKCSTSTGPRLVKLPASTPQPSRKMVVKPTAPPPHSLLFQHDYPLDAESEAIPTPQRSTPPPTPLLLPTPPGSGSSLETDSKLSSNRSASTGPPRSTTPPKHMLQPSKKRMVNTDLKTERPIYLVLPIPDKEYLNASNANVTFASSSPSSSTYRRRLPKIVISNDVVERPTHPLPSSKPVKPVEPLDELTLCELLQYCIDQLATLASPLSTMAHSHELSGVVNQLHNTLLRTRQHAGECVGDGFTSLKSYELSGAGLAYLVWQLIALYSYLRVSDVYTDDLSRQFCRYGRKLQDWGVHYTKKKDIPST